MSEELEKGETSVFAAAAPVTPTDLAEGEETKDERAETKTDAPAAGPKPRPSTGRPTWHLSLTLGLLIALVGSVLLWMQSPELAMLVAGGLIVMVGLALALWYLFGSGSLSRRGGTNRRGTGQGAAGTGTGANRVGGTTSGNRGGTGASGNGANHRRGANAHRDTGANGGDTGASRRRRRGGDGTGDTERRHRPWHRGTDADGRGADRGGTRGSRGGTGGNRGGAGEPRGTRDRQRRRREQQPGAGQPPRQRGSVAGGVRQALTGGGRGNPPIGSRWRRRERPPGFWRERGCVNGGRPPLVRVSKERDAETDKGKKLVEVRPLRWRTQRGKLPVDRPVKPSRTRRVKPPRDPKPTKPATITWPNLDVDHHGGTLPRITIARRAVRLPPRYHGRTGEPNWPTTEPGAAPTSTIPEQRVRRSTVNSTPDLLNRAIRERHFSDAAAVATASAQDKDLQANQFLALAGELDGVEGMENVREQHYADAAAAAADAETRRTKAAVYGFLSQNPN